MAVGPSYVHDDGGGQRATAFGQQFRSEGRRVLVERSKAQSPVPGVSAAGVHHSVEQVRSTWRRWSPLWMRRGRRCPGPTAARVSGSEPSDDIALFAAEITGSACSSA